MRFVDANVFLRAITGDDPVKALASRAFFARLATNDEQAICNETIIAELAYNLVSPRQYGLSHSEATQRIKPYLALRGLLLPNRALCLRAIDIFESHSFLDIEDAFAIARMEADGIDEIFSYDRDFDRIASITRVEP